MSPLSRVAILAVCAAWLSALAGCGFSLMATPNLYRDSFGDLWAKLPEELKTPNAEVVYVTDRKPAKHGKLKYSDGRSESMVFGVCEVNLGGETWDELVALSRERPLFSPLISEVRSVRELGRFPPTPAPPEPPANDPPDVRHEMAVRQLHELIEERLALSDTKDVYVFVHGVSYTLADGALVIAGLWHFLGRQGVPIAYSWPAGTRGGWRGYNYDRESGEFTVFHLKQFLEALAATPSLRRVHLVGHSRGCEVLVSALRELHIKYTAMNPLTPKAAQSALRIGHVVLAAPDIAFDVARQRIEAERLTGIGETLTIYTSEDDLALKLAKWFFEGAIRLGTLGLAGLPREQTLTSARISGINVIHADVQSDLIGHAYFYQNPAVSSDIILLLRDDVSPGDARRPLTFQGGYFWELRDGYPPPTPAAAGDAP